MQTITVFNILLTSELREQYTRSLSYTKICSFGKIQLNIQWHKFTPLSPAKGQLSNQHWKSGKSLTYTSFQVLTQTHTRFTKFSLKSRRTQAPISLECKSRLASRVILALETLVTSVLKEKKKKRKKYGEIKWKKKHFLPRELVWP